MGVRLSGSVFYVFYSFNQLSHQRNMRIVFRRLDSLRGMGVQGEGEGEGRGIDSGKADLAMLVVASSRGPLLTSQ